MFLAINSSIAVRAAAQAVWDDACRPENWTASNPTGHFGLRLDSRTT
ncbi:MAG: hypothetical protein IH606_13180 [Burkholderiales bacterium]|nr:hypothetical protein [Burkholderiales bacterium]